MFSKIEARRRTPSAVSKLIAAAPTAVAPEESGFYAVWSLKAVPLYPDDILWNFENSGLAGRKSHPAFFPDMTPEDPNVMESIKLALAKYRLL